MASLADQNGMAAWAIRRVALMAKTKGWTVLATKAIKMATAMEGLPSGTAAMTVIKNTILTTVGKGCLAAMAVPPNASTMKGRSATGIPKTIQEAYSVTGMVPMKGCSGAETDAIPVAASLTGGIGKAEEACLEGIPTAGMTASEVDITTGMAFPVADTTEPTGSDPEPGTCLTNHPCDSPAKHWTRISDGLLADC